MPFQPGQISNPKGRVPGTRNKRDAEIWRKLEARGDKDPAELLSEIVTNEKDPKELRAQAANMLLPYKYSKRGTLPPPRFVEETIDVPDFTSVEQAEDFLASISKRAGTGELELQSALDISTLVKNWILAKHASVELELKVQAHGGTGTQHIVLTGGLPPLPGTQISMPVLNGADIDGHALPPPSAPQKDGR